MGDFGTLPRTIILHIIILARWKESGALWHGTHHREKKRNQRLGRAARERGHGGGLWAEQNECSVCGECAGNECYWSIGNSIFLCEWMGVAMQSFFVFILDRGVANRGRENGAKKKRMCCESIEDVCFCAGQQV